MDLTNAEFDEIHFETISSDGDASDGDANSEDMDEDELDDVMASMNIADDVIIVPQVQPHKDGGEDYRGLESKIIVD